MRYVLGILVFGTIVAGCGTSLVIPCVRGGCMALSLNADQISVANSPYGKLELFNTGNYALTDVMVEVLTENSPLSVNNVDCSSSLSSGGKCGAAVQIDPGVSSATANLRISYRVDSLPVSVLRSLEMTCNLVASPSLTHTISESQTVASSSLPISTSVSIPKFSGNGELTSVSIDFAPQTARTYRVENTAVFPCGGYTVTASSDATLTYTDGEVIGTHTLPGSFASGALPGYDGVTDYLGTSGITSNQIANASNTAVYSDAASLAKLQGSGNATLPVTINSNFSLSSCGTVSASSTLLGSALVTVNYTYQDRVCDLSTLKFSLSEPK